MLGVVQPSCNIEGGEYIERMKICRGVLDLEAFRELHLTVKPKDTKIPSLEVGLTYASKVAAATFFTSS